jgi:L-threonylcarbamoyladenylate synthase
MPAFDLATSLINKVGIPIAAPSANRSGRPSATSCEHVMNDFNGLIPCILKSPSTNSIDCLTKYGLESTVVNCSGEQPILLRMGSIPFEEIQKVIPNLIHYQTLNSQKESQSILSVIPLSPGMKYRHYSPQAKVILIRSLSELPLDNESKAFTSSGFIGLEASVDSHSFQNIFQKSLLCSSVEEYGANLFSFFRDCDSEHIQTIFCETPPRNGLGNTIMDRLIKASLD